MKKIHTVYHLGKRMLILPLAAIIMTACGGDDDSPAPTSVSGLTVDGYISGATVFLDLNSDQTFNEGEPHALSNENGAYTLDVSNVSSAVPGMTVIALGGVDIDSGLPFQGQFMHRIENQEEHQVLSPFNTLAFVMVEKSISPTIGAARALIADKFGFDAADVGADPVALRNVKPLLYANQLALQQALQLMASKNPDGEISAHRNQYRMMEAFAQALRNQNQGAGVGDCIRAMNLNQVTVTAQFTERLRNAIQLALGDEDQVRQQETLRTLLQTMTQLRQRLQDCDDCQLADEALQLELRLQLQAGSLSGLMDDNTENDATSLQLFRMRNQ